MSNLTAIANGPSTSSPSDGSRTQTIHDSQPRVDDHPSNPSHNQGSTPQGVLRLRGGPKSKPAVVWREDVVDNENMGKKSSKSVSHHPFSQYTTTFADLSLLPMVESVCCIYHKAKKFGESSSEESSSDSDCDHDHRRHRHHRSANGNGGAERERDGEGAQVEELENDDEPNAYERPSGWKRNKEKRNANSESLSFGFVHPVLTYCSLSKCPHVSTIHIGPEVLRGRCEHWMPTQLDSYLSEERV